MSDTDTAQTTEVEAPVSNEQVVEEMVNESPAAEVERPEWLMDKYMPEGKTVEEATSEQAKAYKELSSKFGSFTGAPESYELTVSEELKEAGFDVNPDDPLFEKAMEFAKTSNMSQDGFNGMVELFGMSELAKHQAEQEYKDNQLKELGLNAESRIKNLNEWASRNLDEETLSGVQEMATTANGVKALEQLISMTRKQSVAPDNSTPVSAGNADEVRKMQFELDGNGNRRINTDPDFKARYIKLRDSVHGTEDHRQMFG